MQRYLFRAMPLIHIHKPTAASTACRFATASHPNPGNFANRPKNELSKAGRKGGRKGGKAHAGSFQFMDPEKQHEIASRGGRAVNKAAAERPGGRVYREAPSSISEPGQPSTAPPGYEPTAPA